MNASAPLSHALDVPGLVTLDAPEATFGGGPGLGILVELVVPVVLEIVLQDWSHFRRGFAQSARLWRIPT